jgi:hypothetical protein
MRKERESTPGSVPSEPSQGRWVLVKNENPATDGIGSLLFFLKHTTSSKEGRHGQPALIEHAIEDVDDIRTIGFQIAIDMIGNGYSF